MEKSPKINLKTVDKLLSNLPERISRVLERRFGIGKTNQRETLDAIGKSYGITRERVRQIEEYGLKKIREDSAFRSLEPCFDEIRNFINQRGGIVCEREFEDNKDKNYIRFLLTVGGDFERLKEDSNFHSRWTIDKNRAEKTEGALEKLHRQLSENEVISEEDLLVRLAGCAGDNLRKDNHPPVLKSWLSLSRLLGQNFLGEWGFVSSPQIRPRGMKDLSYLVMKQHGSPMHFTEVAKAIENLASLKAHPQTVHNELIKDDRFVLVGRGLYALGSWGYQPGLVRDVIKKILSSSGPLKKEDIIKLVLQERHVKENTILINLNNRSLFKKNQDNTYFLI